MSTFINLATKELCHEGDIRLEYPEITENLTGDTFPCPNTHARVEIDNRPECTKYETAELNPPECVNGVWRLSWKKRVLSPAELERIARFQAESEAGTNL